MAADRALAAEQFGQRLAGSGDMAIAQRRLTLEQFLRLPEEEPALEYEYGRVIQKEPVSEQMFPLPAGRVDAVE
jgi:hypothetical protein